MGRLALVLGVWWSLSASVQASSIASLPLSDQPVRYEAEQARLRVARVGLVHASDARLSVAKREARKRGRARAWGALHAYLDGVLAGCGASPRAAALAHQALQQAGHRVQVRPLVDGSAVVVVEVELEPLRSAVRCEGSPWER